VNACDAWVGKQSRTDRAGLKQIVVARQSATSAVITGRKIGKVDHSTHFGDTALTTYTADILRKRSEASVLGASYGDS
jgi:hypothetical protein